MTKYWIAAALAAITAPLPAAVPAPPTAAAQGEVRLDHISVVKRGRGPALVLIPGLGSPRASWDKVIAGLDQRHTLYLVQVNGFGGDAPGANLKPGILDGIVADLDRYLATQKAGPVRLAGHSMGGLAAMMFARAHPGQVERLMIVDALPWFPVLLARGGPDPTPAQVEPIARMMRDTVAARHGKPVDAAKIAADVAGLAVKPDSKAQMAKWAAAADPRVTAQLLYEDMATDVRPALATMTMPITVVVPWDVSGFGKERTMAFYQRQYATAPKLTLVDIPESGHFVMLDQPARFAAALAAFLKR